MGRKLHRKVPTRPKPSIPRIFECPRCEAEAVKIEMKESPIAIATVMCGNCHITITFTNIKKLYDKVDIFGIWVDDYYDELEKGLISEEYDKDPVEDSKPSNDELKEDSEIDSKPEVKT